ncbi:MAG: hypothetical protein JSV88_16515 [Candidatus Aminicenantes bacterium]|nr:MAG: hypothetical protein JSV88_16515 [Candidatus Aminicenantes bacterium]
MFISGFLRVPPCIFVAKIRRWIYDFFYKIILEEVSPEIREIVLDMIEKFS